ncbi:MAG: multicopper oxidase family protein [Inquilinaceae bacterium]
MVGRRATIKGLLLAGGAVTAGTAVGALFGTDGGAAFAASPKPLAIPPLMTGETRDGVRVFDLALERGISRFFDDVETPTLGINGAYLGPTLEMRAGERVRLNVANGIGMPSTLHWHGMHVPAHADGGPHQVIRTGATWSPEFEVRQRAAMVWYHSHMVPETGPQVYHGLAGAIYLRDDETDRLDLPRDYGVDDIPLIVQDRAFNRDGSFYYSASMHDRMMGMQGNVLLVNGVAAPYFRATAARLRLRLLNGSNARSYVFGFGDGRSFHLIGSDGGLLERPHRTDRVALSPGERAEIVVDLTGGQPVALRAVSPANTGPMGGGMMGRGMIGGAADDIAVDVLEIRPDGGLARPPAMPERLIALPRPDPSSAVGTRRFVFDMGMGGMMAGGGFTINGRSMDMTRIDERVTVGTSEIWEIENTSPLAHPVHIHDVQFRLLDRNGAPPSPAEAGLKDTVLVGPQERVRLLLGFADYADPDAPYMYHCHILEHEDAGMMGQFVVTT